MKSVIKTIITVFVSLFCCFICILAFGLYLSETNYLKYDAERMIDVEILDVEVENLGKEFEEESKEGYTCYLLKLTIDNPSNYGRDGYSFYLTYDTGAYGDFYYIDELESSLSFDHYDNNYYLPPGKESTVYITLMIEDGCEKMDIVYRNYETDTTQRVPVDL